MGDYTLDAFRPGQRIELEPFTDTWMLGDRFGEVLRTGRTLVHVRLDRSGRVRKFRPEHIGRVL